MRRAWWAALRLRLGLEKPTLVRGGALQGRSFYQGASEESYIEGTNEVPVQDALAELLAPGDVFYDIGANVGYFSVVAAGIVGSTGGVVAFEPVPVNALYVRRNAAINDMAIDVREQAVGERSGPGVLNVAAYSGGSALEGVDVPPDRVGTMTVEVVSIDDLVAARSVPPPTVVKVDVEGGEMLVLRGMQRTLADCRPALVLEFDGEDAASVADKAAACIELLQTAGYAVKELPECYPDIMWCVRHFVALPEGQGA